MSHFCAHPQLLLMKAALCVKSLTSVLHGSYAKYNILKYRGAKQGICMHMCFFFFELRALIFSLVIYICSVPANTFSCSQMVYMLLVVYLCTKENTGCTACFFVFILLASHTWAMQLEYIESFCYCNVIALVIH